MSDALFNNNLFNRITGGLPCGVRRFVCLSCCAALLISSAFAGGASEAGSQKTSKDIGSYSETASSAAYPAAPAAVRGK